MALGSQGRWHGGCILRLCDAWGVLAIPSFLKRFCIRFRYSVQEAAEEAYRLNWN